MMLRASCFACVLVHAAAAWANPRVATATTPEAASPPSGQVDRTTDVAPRAQHGLAIGAELGDPVSATAGWFSGNLAVLGAIGTGTLEGAGIQLHADAQLVITRLAPDVPIRVGLGARYYHHGYQPASIDELPDDHLGIRVPAAIALERGSLQLYAEAAPGIDIAKSRSCSLASGAFSVCPHAQESPFFFQLVVGARWFLSH